MAKGFNPRARKQYPFPNPQDRGFSKNILRPQNVVKPQPPFLLRGKVAREIRDMDWISGDTKSTYDNVD